MDAVTYPDPDVSSYLTGNFIPLRLMLNTREDAGYFRSHRIIWTPTAGFMDRNGSLHYQAPGYLPASDFLSVLKIGKARCLMAWTRTAEAATELISAAESENAYTPEVLFWLGVARYLERRDSSQMWEAWDRLTSHYPDSPWAHKVYPRDQHQSPDP